MSRTPRDAEAIRRWLATALAARVGLRAQDLGPDVPIAAFGLASRDAVELSGELEEWLGITVSPTIAYEYPTIRELCAFLASDDSAATVGSHETVPIGGDPIAIVGLACRFPGAPDAEAFWALLRDGVDAVTDVPAGRWSVAAHHDDPAAPGRIASRSGGFVDGLDRFDAQLFNIAPREARSMDPQQRLLLETSWQALENAGIPPDSLAGSRTGVFFGVSGHDYADLHMRFGTDDDVDAYLGTGNAGSVAAGRVSYVFGLNGPSLVVDTACSSSLVAVHLAVRSLRGAECALALAGGVNVLLSPEPSIGFTKAQMLSPRGRCRTFDASADGYVRGEGCGVVVLRRLVDARARGDRILAVIRGTAINQDGRSAGLTAPNGTAQTKVIRAAWRDGGVEGEAIGYVEAHGTGTLLGDPIEVRALAEALGTERAALCGIGSVKTNLGHLEAAAGVAGLIKVVLGLQHQQIPANLHLDTLNPHIEWGTLPVFVPRSTITWPTIDGRRLAGVSSFGFSGTNAHAVVEEAPISTAETREPDGPCLLRVSARTDEALAASLDRWAAFLERTRTSDLADVCLSGNTGRAEFPIRAAAIGDSPIAMAAALRAARRGMVSPDVIIGHGRADRAARVAFLFTGQGSQYVGMGRALYKRYGAFREALDRCGAILEPLIDCSLHALLYDGDADAVRLSQTAYSQPALFSIEYALAALWRSWGIVPSAVLGHSLGEWTAACVAGMVNLDDALTCVVARGRLMQAQEPLGKMAAVGIDESELVPMLSVYDGDVVVAAVNAPSELVISGHRAAVDEVLGLLTRRGVNSKELAVSHAFHSPLMDPILDPFGQVVAGVRFREPVVAFFSSVTCRQFDGRDAVRPEYWRDQVRQPVRYAEAVRALASATQLEINACVECGPGTALLGLARECVPEDRLRWIPSIVRTRDESRQMLESLGVLYTAGATVDWNAVDRAPGRKQVAVPTYPFQRERHWMPAAERAARGDRPTTPAATEASGHPFLTRRLRSPRLTDAVFESSLTSTQPAYLNDHKVVDRVVLPASAYLEAAVAALAACGRPLSLRDVRFTRPLILDDTQPHLLQTLVGADGTVEIVSGLPEHPEWRSHFTARAGEAVAIPTHRILLERVAEWSIRTPDDLYAEMRRSGLEYGPSFQTIAQLSWRGNEAVAGVRIADDDGASLDRYLVHPAILDGCFQALAAVASSSGALAADTTYVPASIERFDLRQAVRGPVLVHALMRSIEPASADSLMADLVVADADGSPIAIAEGFCLRAVPRGRIQAVLGVDPIDNWIHRVDWQLAPAPFTTESGMRCGRWVIASPGSPLDEALATELAARGGSGEIVAIGADSDVVQSAIDLALRRGPVAGVVLVAEDGLAADTREGTERLEGAHALVTSALRLAQMASALGSSPRVAIVTRGVHGIGGPPSAAGIFQAPLWGFNRSLTIEHPELRPVTIDLDPDTNLKDARALVHELVTPSGDDEVALRASGRFVRRLAPYTGQSDGNTAGVRREATYLVTGGTGELGLVVAEWLASRGAGRIVLVSRRPPQARVVERITQLEQHGADVMWERADVAVRSELEGVLLRAHEERSPLRGIVHAAGTLSPALLSQMTPAQIDDVLAAKMDGAWNLHALAQHETLDWLVLFSSFAALVPEPGQANYAAGNAFLDALAAYRTFHRQPTLSVNWGPWAAGLSTASTLADGRERISPDAAVRLLERLIASGLSNAAAMPLAWDSRAAALFARLPLFSAIRPAMPPARRRPGDMRDRWRRAAGVDRTPLIEAYLREEIARILRLDPLSLEDTAPLATFGLDSLTGMELRDRVTADLAVAIPMTTFVRGPSLRELAAAIGIELRTAEEGSARDSTDGDAVPNAGAVAPDLVPRVDDLSEAEIDSLLADLMSNPSNRPSSGEAP